MIEEVVNSIIEAEDAAAQKIADAKNRANDIIADAEIRTAEFRKQKSAENKAIFAGKSKEIQLNAEKKSAEELSELNVLADKEVADYEKNVDAAVKIILEHLL